jgi:hypothetical protein
MKKVFIIFFLLASFCLLVDKSFADWIEEGYRSYRITPVLNNIDNFKDYIFVSYSKDIMGRGDTRKILTKDDNIISGRMYKLDELNIYAIKKDYFKEKGSVDNVDFETVNDKVYKSDLNIWTESGGVKTNILGEDVEYTIKGISANNKLIIYKSKQVTHYNDGLQDKVEYFGYTGTEMIVKGEKVSFWQRLSCFFRTIFGKGCDL